MPVYTILIVDDEANQRFMLEQALFSPDKWSIKTVSSGTEALAHALEQLPDLIITDYHMLSMNGLELVTALRQHGISSHIIMMTAYSSPELMEAAQDLQVDHYLAKPVPIKVLRCLTATTIGTPLLHL